jgi:hypothetical protein
MMATESIYMQIVGVAEGYLGPAADRFVSRQIEFHLKKRPDQITKGDIPQVLEWIKVSLALLTEDKNMVNSLIEEIKKISDKNV